MSMYHIHTWCFRKSEEDIRPLKTRVRDHLELLDEVWELNLGPLEEQPVLLMAATSLQNPVACS